MAQFAVIENGYVLNVILADSKEIAEEVTGLLCVEAGGGVIGATYNEETGEFILPVFEEPLAPEEPVIAPVVPIEETPAE